MKNNGSTIGGSLQPQYYAVYAQYFVKYIQQMQARGVLVHAVTVQMSLNTEEIIRVW